MFDSITDTEAPALSRNETSDHYDGVIRSLMTSNSTKGFEDLAADYCASLYRLDPDAVLDALACLD